MEGKDVVAVARRDGNVGGIVVVAMVVATVVAVVVAATVVVMAAGQDTLDSERLGEGRGGKKGRGSHLFDEEGA